MATPVEIVLLSGVAAFDAYSFYKLRETEEEYREKLARQQQLKSQGFKYQEKQEVKFQEKQQDETMRGNYTNVNVNTSTEKTDSQKKLENDLEPTVIRVEERPIEVEYHQDKTSDFPIRPNSELDERVFNLEKTLMTETHDRISRLEVRLDSMNDSIGSRLHEIDSKLSSMPSSPELLIKIESTLNEISKKIKETNGNLEVVSMKVGLLEGRQEKFTDKIKKGIAREHKAVEKQAKIVKKKQAKLSTKISAQLNDEHKAGVKSRKKNKTTVVNVRPVVKLVNAKPKVQKKVSKPKSKATVINLNPVVKVVNSKPRAQRKQAKPRVSKTKTVNTKISKSKNNKDDDVEVNVTVNK